MAGILMLEHGLLRGRNDALGDGSVVEFGLERGKEGIGEFDEAGIGAGDDAAVDDPIDDEREKEKRAGQDGCVPKGEAAADGIKHHVSWLGISLRDG